VRRPGAGPVDPTATTSLRARALGALLRRTIKRRAQRLATIGPGTLEASRRRLGLVARFIRPPHDVRVEPLAAPAGEWLVPEGAHGVGLYLHGGAYAVGSPRLYRGLAGRLAAATRCRVLVPAYRLAPEHPFPAALRDAGEAWTTVTAGRTGALAWLAGDSAGGGLALALAQALAASAGPAPSALALISPWTDLTASGASVGENARLDPLLSAHLLEPAARNYLQGTDPRDPRTSPLFGSMTGLPPVRVHACATEILRDDATRLVSAIRDSGGRASLRLYGDLPHVFHAFAPLLPEAAPALADLATHLAQHVQAAPGRERGAGATHRGRLTMRP
jgi:acetyl esterase/lipase